MDAPHTATPDTASPILSTAATTVPNIMPHHLAKLRSSGLRDEIIQAAGIYSESDKNKLATILDTKRCPFKSAALVLPYVDADGHNGYARVRPDSPRLSQKKPVKYESPRGRRNQVYLPPGVAKVLPDAAQELLTTEGELKALAATQEGFPCIGLVGVFGWKEKHREALLPDLERIEWKGRRVFIVFDSDIADKPGVQDAESRLAAQLQNRGAIVKVVRIPQGEHDKDGKPTKQGLDDYLVTQPDPKRAMRELLDAAEDPTPPDAESVKRPAKEMDSTTEGPAFLEKTRLDGVFALRFWRGSWHHYARGAYRERQPAEVRSKLVQHLMQDFFALGQRHTGDALDVVKALALLDFSIEPPAWLGKVPVTWPADEILVANNGLVHLPSLVTRKDDCVRPATPRFFTQSALDYDFTLDAPCPTEWLAFLSQLWPNDPESISTLQEWFGYCLTPDTRQQKILMKVGPKRSGKGTVARILRALVGKENVCGPTLASLGTNFGLWPLLGKAVGIISDARLSGRTDSSIVVERLLSISGEDALTVDRKNLEPVTCKLPTRITILSNELPRLGDSSGALAGRMIILRLTNSFYGREDHALTDKLLAELPGILLWAIDGWRRLRERGRFVQPQAAGELVNDLADLTSPVAAFLRECCHVGSEYEVMRTDLYARYREWCEEKGQRFVDDERGFGRNLRAAVASLADRQHRIEGAPIRFYGGVGLK